MHRTKNFLFAIVALSFVFEFACIDHPVRAADLPDYMKVIVGDAPPASATDVANQNVLALDLAMFGLCDDAQAKFQKNFLSEHPVILALFSNQGGKLTLIRPGKPPLDAPRRPFVIKSTNPWDTRALRFSSWLALTWALFLTSHG